MRLRHFVATVLAAVAMAAGAVTMTAPAAQASTGSTPCAPTARACVDPGTQQAWLMDNGRVTYGPVPTRTGKDTAPTTPGTFEVTWKDKDHVSKEFDNAPMPNSVFFDNKGEAFHEGSLSKYSNGCVHLSHAASETFFGTLQVGDQVQVV